MTYSLISDSYVKRIAKFCFTKYFIAAWCNPFLLYHFSRPGTCAVTLRLHARFPLRRLLLKMKYMKWIKWRIKWSTNDSLLRLKNNSRVNSFKTLTQCCQSLSVWVLRHDTIFLKRLFSKSYTMVKSAIPISWNVTSKKWF